jgi:hypothetical protein
VQILDELEEENPRHTARESRRVTESEEDSNMVPTYIVPAESRNMSNGKKRHKSMGRMKPKQNQLETKAKGMKKEEKSKRTKEGKKKKVE